MTTATRKSSVWKRAGHTKDQKLRTERMTAIVIWAVMAAVMALVIWLAMLGNTVSDGVDEFWPLMP
jgi:hypothetical protein